MRSSLARYFAVLGASVLLMPGLVVGQTRGDGGTAPALPPGIRLKDPVIYEVKMTTRFAVPADAKGIDKLSVWHALPALRPWSKVAGPVGASNTKWSAGGKQQYDREHDSHHVLWTKGAPVKPRTVFEYESEFTVRSVLREFMPDKAKVKWKDYQNLAKTPAGKSSPGGPKRVHPTIAEAADKIKVSSDPAQAVMEFSKWIKTNLQYDASVFHETDDVASTLKTRRGHCGHRSAVFEQFCVRCGIQVRRVAGLTLYAPNGRSELDAIRADYSNIHGWAEVYFPGIGWVEVEPAGGDQVYAIPAEWIRNTQWLQTYAIWVHDNGRWKAPAWTIKDGKYVSDYGVEHRITFKSRPDSASPVANDKAKPADPFADNSMWINEEMKATLTVVERKGESFRAKFVIGETIDRDISGTVKDPKVTWLATDVRAVKGGRGGDNTGTISGDRIDFEFRNANGMARAYTLRLNRGR